MELKSDSFREGKKAENNFCLDSTYQPRVSLRYSVSFLETAYTTNHLKQ